MENDNTVYILDSYGLIFRAYFAFISRPLTNSKGQNVSAVFGFFRNLHWILQHYNPKYLFAAMDSKTKTFRHEMYTEYKATRNKTPDDLHAQIPWIEDILHALGIPVLQCDGYEADDVIATVAKKCEEQKRECRILSGDKDLMQLVNDNCKILKPETGGSTWKITDAAGVEAEWGVRPEKLLDLLSLYGDTADNVPGVHGVGVKTAAKLLSDYNDLNGIYEHIDEIKGAMQQKLIDGKENAFFSQKLIKLCNTVPCSEIDDALNSKPYTYNYNAAAEKLKFFEAFAVAKSYAELAVETSGLKTSSVIANDFSISESEEILNVKQNDTSNYRAITSLNELEKYIDSYLCKVKETPIAYDSETTSLDTFNCSLLGFSLCYEKGKAVYIPLMQNQAQDLFSENNYISKDDAFVQLRRLFSNPDVDLIMHNAKFDLKVLINNNFISDKSDVFSSIKCRILDTMIISWLLNPERLGKGSFSLEYLSETILGLKGIEFSDIVEKGQSFADVPLEQAYRYASEDADFTLQLYLKLIENKKYEKITKSIEDNSLFTGDDFSSLYEMEMKVLPILTQMELNGIHLERKTLKDYSKELSEKLLQIEQAIYREVGHVFLIASPKQLQTVLFEERHLKPGKKTKTGYSTDTSVLEELAKDDVVPKMILEYRELAKLLSTYVQTLPEMCDKDERIHTDFIQTGTATGRLSCREPNLQNIPVKTEEGRKIRTAFTAPDGKVLISADYSQIELVVLAHLSNDKNMSSAFINGTDVHKMTASLIYNVGIDEVTTQMRRTAKTINFGVIYGMSAFRLAQDLEISRTQAQQFITNYFNQYSGVNNFINETVQKAKENGFVETILKRERPVLNINSKNKIEQAAAERIAVNSPVQGSAADIVKIAMIKVNKALKESNLNVRLLLQVHDELIFEAPDDKDVIEKAVSIIRENMEKAVTLRVPLKVSIEYGKNWGEFHG